MRTARFSGHLGGGLSAQEGVYAWEGLYLGGGGGGVCLGMYTHTLPIAYWDTYTPPKSTEFLTHACENITFPQLMLRVEIKFNIFRNFAGLTTFSRARSTPIFPKRTWKGDDT